MAFPSDIQQQVYDLLSRSSNLAIVPADPVEPTLAPGQQVLTLAPGQRVTAEVIGQPQSGKIPVQIGNQQLQLDLQLPVRQGQNLELTFVGNDPRPTFAMSRPGVTAPPVTLTDASRLLSLLVSNEQLIDPRQRSSLQSISDLLRQSSGDSSVLAGFLDDVLTYRTDGRAVVVAPGGLPDRPEQQVGQEAHQPPGGGGAGAKTAVFEDAASKLLLNLAQRSRLVLVDVANHPLSQLPLNPGEEANALVMGQLPGGRTVVQLAGNTLELLLPKPATQGEILRLVLITQQPKPIFALLGQPSHEQGGTVSEAARWLSAMARTESGNNEVQHTVMARLQQVISSLPQGSSALAAIMGEAMTYGASTALSSGGTQQSATVREGRVDEGMFKLLQALMQGDRLALLEPKVGSEAVAGFQAGQQLRGEVLQALGGGRFMVQVGNQAMLVTLPKTLKVGDRLNLFFVGNDPPSFLMVRYGTGGEALVSKTASWISNLLGMQSQATPLQEGLGVLRTLLQGAPSDPAQLEQLLQKGLKESGLFYESHLTRWFSGEYALDDLLREPQGRLSADDSSTRTALVHHDTEGVDPRTQSLIKEQLATLQTGQLLFQGELFPGQQMEWRIRERDGGGRQSSHERKKLWDTELSIELPHLGTIAAEISLDGADVDVRITSGAEPVVELLHQELGRLKEQLAASGLTPGAIEVQQGEQ